MIKSTSPNRIVVTGGAGFVASNIVCRLLDEGSRVVVLDDFFTGSESNLPVGHPALEIVRGSVTDYALVREVVDGSPLVIHEAARNIIASTRNPRDDYEVNIGGTLNVLLAAREGHVSRVVYSSSCSIYGNSRYLPANEDDPANMLSPYAVSKYAGENYCKAFYENYGLSTSVVRYSNVFGPRQLPSNPYCGVIGKFLQAAINGTELMVHGDGEQTRDYTYVDDAVEATLLVARSQKADGQVYNVATGREVSINSLIRMICSVSAKDIKVDYVDRRDIDNIRRRVLNIERLRRDLRWSPRVTLEKGLQRTYQWMLDNL